MKDFGNEKYISQRFRWYNDSIHNDDLFCHKLKLGKLFKFKQLGNGGAISAYCTFKVMHTLKAEVVSGNGPLILWLTERDVVNDVSWHTPETHPAVFLLMWEVLYIQYSQWVVGAVCAIMICDGLIWLTFTIAMTNDCGVTLTITLFHCRFSIGWLAVICMHYFSTQTKMVRAREGERERGRERGRAQEREGEMGSGRRHWSLNSLPRSKTNWAVQPTPQPLSPSLRGGSQHLPSIKVEKPMPLWEFNEEGSYCSLLSGLPLTLWHNTSWRVVIFSLFFFYFAREMGVDIKTVTCQDLSVTLVQH